ncbi:MAG: FAD-dependent oxidoreductase [Opitutales bacterium]|nr:FAD-dependent oxidoreductase [Opitutales bacterium]
MTKTLSKLVSLGMAILAIVGCSSVPQVQVKNVYQGDVIIYGGTSGAVVAAIRAAKSGKKVFLVSPEENLGAMTSSGLGMTDSGKTHAIGGLSREFYKRVYQEYKDPKHWYAEKRSEFGGQGQGTKAINEKEKTMWIFEPRIASIVYKKWLAEYPNITIHKGQYLDRDNGVEMKDKRILSITTLAGNKYIGKMFIDAGFEGDLMASAGCEYTTGREGNAKYNEDFNGYRDSLRHNYHNFGGLKVDPYKIKGDPSSGLLKYISAEKPLKNGAPDKKIQAYNYRMCLTSYEPNKIPITKPENYNPEDYELCGRWFEADPNAHPLIISRMPNHKTDMNNKQAFSTDFIGENYAYPDASYEERARIAKAHKDYQLGLLYFFLTDPRTPKAFKDKISKYGLPKDEFTNTGNWPFYMYIREARRLVGEYVMTQHDCQNTKATPEPIGMGSYTLDSHNTSRFVTEEGYVQNEGDVEVTIGASGPYKISYGSIIPKRKDCRNLYVVCAVSSSHIAYGSIRMEPVFMILGHSAAAAAVQSIDDNLDVQDIDYIKLAKTLRREGQILNVRK